MGWLARQATSPHPLAACGYRTPPHWLCRFSKRLYRIAAAAIDIWLIATGRLTLHRAWQAGYDCRCGATAKLNEKDG